MLQQLKNLVQVCQQRGHYATIRLAIQFSVCSMIAVGGSYMIAIGAAFCLLVELLLQPLICIVDAQLLKAVLLEAFKPIDIQDTQ